MSKRRANGEGTIYYDKQRKVWVCQITEGRDPRTGKLKRKTFTAKTKRGALDKRDNYLAAIKRGEVVSKNNILLIDWLYEYLESFKKNKISSNTYIVYKNSIDSYFKGSYIGKTKLQKLTTLSIQKFYNNLYENGKTKSKDGLAPSTIKNLSAFLNSALNKAVKLKYILENPAEECELPKEEEKEEGEHYNEEEIKKILSSIEENNVYEYMIKLAIATGLRQGELMALTWNDIDFKNSIIKVKHSVSRKENDNDNSNKKYIKYVKSPKTKQGIRKVPINDNIIKMLRRYKEKIAKADKSNKNNVSDKNLVFTTKNGSLINAPTLRYNWIKIVKKSGVRYLTFHKLRASYASLLSANKISLIGVQSLLGHKRSSTTSKYYTFASDSEKKEAAAIMDELYK
jgi:integrase